MFSGLASVVILVLMKFFSRPQVPDSWWITAAGLCFVFASYRVWLKERRALDKFESEEKAPLVVADYNFSFASYSSNSVFAAQMSVPFTISNLHDSPAFNVKIRDMQVGQSRAVFPETLTLVKNEDVPSSVGG